MKRNKSFILIGIVSIVIALIFSYAGHFLFEPEPKPQKPIILKSPNTTEKKEKEISPVEYKHISTEIDGNKQEINILEIDLNSKKVRLEPILSNDSTFGFEELSSMSKRKNAYAAVNAGFFYEYGQPIGMVVINGQLVTASTGKFPVFVFDGSKAGITQLKSELWLVLDGKKLKVTGINTPGKSGDVIVYTGEYGTTNRAKSSNFSIKVANGVITETASLKGETDIPRNGFVVTFYGSAQRKPEISGLTAGISLSLESIPALNKDYQAYECGSWVVRDGKSAVPARDDWVGVMTNYDPRTAIGIKYDGKVVLVTVDGRQPGYSTGFTGKELAQYLIEYGVKDAAMLDGGASTEMLIHDKLVNHPSFKGQERLLGGGLIIVVN
ncbi:MAG: phosphodiester glycosidase family protein [Bacillota bacterium]|nr:phosphodiester glycosidase family protein [Bacillota bacterium]